MVLTLQLKHADWLMGKKTRPKLASLAKHTQPKSERMVNGNQIQSWVTILISDNIDIKPKLVREDKVT
jgi:hypothetical protein